MMLLLRCSDEKAFLMGKCTAILQRFYDSKSHQKKSIQAGGLGPVFPQQINLPLI